LRIIIGVPTGYLGSSGMFFGKRDGFAINLYEFDTIHGFGVHEQIGELGVSGRNFDFLVEYEMVVAVWQLS
jgi:hypothetical protein